MTAGAAHFVIVHAHGECWRLRCSCGAVIAGAPNEILPELLAHNGLPFDRATLAP